jgi:D-inositol-3-phosphate glycosyltransferase
VTVEHVDAGPPRPLPKDTLLPYMDGFADRLAAAWRAQPPDVVHAHFWMSGRAAIAAARAVEVPVVQTFHALGVVKRRHQAAKDTSPPERIDEERRILAEAAGVIATCDDEVRELRALGGDPRRIRVVPCGVDLGRFRPDGAWERRGRRARLAVVGRLVERKGVADVVSALAALPDAEVVVAGGPRGAAARQDPVARALADQATALGVAERVEFRGGIDQADVPALLRSADVAVSVPWYEPFGIAPVEAMACGVPVVVSAVGGMLDTVVHDVTGLHVPPRSPGLLGAALGALLADPHRRARLGAAGLLRAHQGYGWARVAQATLDAYRAFGRRAGRRSGGRLGGAASRRAGRRAALAMAPLAAHREAEHDA